MLNNRQAVEHVPDQRLLYLGRRTISLTPLENRLFAYLYNHANSVCSTDELLENVWPEGRSRSVVEKAIGRLRDKIEKDRQNPQYIFAIRGEGYMLRLDRQEVAPLRTLTFEQPAEQVQALFFRPAERGSESFLEETWITLLHTIVEIDDTELDILLEATKLVEPPNTARLALYVKAKNSVRASLQWGGYEKTVVVPGYSRIILPPLPLSDVVDEMREQIDANLYLTVGLVSS